jgi:Fuc2NAc and GlcNAc transferase
MIAIICISCIASFALVALMRRIAMRSGIMDEPNERSSHTHPMPRGGGLAIALVTLTAVAINTQFSAGWIVEGGAWILGGSIVAAAGFVDDLRHLSAGVRAGIHFAAALILLAAAGGLPLGTFNSEWLGWVFGAIAIVWLINSFNFMDGIDGLAAMQTVFVATAGALIACSACATSMVQLPLYALAGAAVGFLYWNFPPAKIFMGDVGSGFIGFSIAAAAMFSAKSGDTNLWTWIVLDALFIADATTTLVGRLIGGERIYEAHRSHVYQRLARRWGSHSKVAFVYTAINVVWCLPWAVATVLWRPCAPIFAAAAFLPLIAIGVATGAGNPDSLFASGSTEDP